MKKRNPFQVNILITPLNSWLLCLSLCCLLSPVWGQSFPAAPNDFVIEQIKRLHKDPKLVIYESKRALARESSKRRKIELNYILALSHIKLAQLTEAENFVFRGLENSNATTFPLMYHRLLLAKAQIMNKRGKPAAGLALSEVVAKWATTQNIVQLNIGALMTGALMDWQLGFRQTALGKFNNAYHLATTNKTQVPAPHIAGHIGRIHTELQEPKIAIPYLQQSLNFAKNKNNMLLQRTALIELSRAYKLNNDFELSHQLLGESRKIASDMRDLNAIAKIDFELAELEKAQNESNKALNHYSKVISLANKFEDPELIFETYFGLAQTHLKLGNIEESRRYFEQAESKAKFLDIEELSHRIQKFKARLLFAEGQLLEAFSALDNGIKMEKQFSSGENQKAL